MAFDQRPATELSANERTTLATFFCMQRGQLNFRRSPPGSHECLPPEVASRRDADLATPLHLHLANARTPDGVTLELVQILAPHCSLWEYTLRPAISLGSLFARVHISWYS